MKKKITKMMLILLAMGWTNVVVAQSKMKAPERFKLKNGLTFIIAENEGLGKIYSRITVENEISEDQKIYAQVLDAFLTKQASLFNENSLAPEKLRHT